VEKKSAMELAEPPRKGIEPCLTTSTTNQESSKPENFKNSIMDNTKLNRTSHSYPTKPEATDLNTIDIWLPESKSPSKEDGKTWVMCVKVLLQPVAC
jgi:hypothetical protein